MKISPKLIDDITRVIRETCNMPVSGSNVTSEEESPIEEISTSANAGAFSTPNAFSSNGDSTGSQHLKLDPQYTFSQKPNNQKRNTVNMKESIAFHDKHPELAKKYGIVGPISNSQKALELATKAKKTVYTQDDKRFYIVDPKLDADLVKAGFRKIEESTSSPAIFKSLPFRQNWDFPVIGKLTQNTIRDSFSKILGGSMFGTAAVNWYKQSGPDVILTIDIANYDDNTPKAKLQMVAKVMSKLAGVDINFMTLVRKQSSEDLSGYEPGMFSQQSGEPGYENRFATITSTKAKFKIPNCKIVE